MTAVSSDAIHAGPSTTMFDRRPPLQGFGRDLRDPYVFKGPDNRWKMLLGGADETAALVLLYETEDADAAHDWRSPRLFLPSALASLRWMARAKGFSRSFSASSGTGRQSMDG